jgi:hypothetical protein
VRSPFRSVGWSCLSEALAPPFTPCGYAVDFVRSCFAGYWRFFTNRLDVVTPGRLFFVPDSTPHLPFMHCFGSGHWNKGDDGPDSALPHLGHDPEIGESYFRGGPPPVNVQLRTFGDPTDFSDGTVLPFPNTVRLRDGVDLRCFPPDHPPPDMCWVDVANDNCAWLRIQCCVLEAIGDLDFGAAQAALQIIFGPNMSFRSDAGVGLFPPFLLCKSPTCNMVFCFGTNSASQLATQFWQGRNGPQRVGPFTTLPIWMAHAGRVANAMNAFGLNCDNPTTFCGHSYGAAVASLLYATVKQADTRRRCGLTAFGCPKPGGGDLLDFINEHDEYIAIHNVPDMVPQIPPSGLLRLQVQAVFPFLPDDWFTGWKPFARYLKLFPGQPFVYGPYFDATFGQYLQFITFMMLAGSSSPFTAHFARQYCAALALRCPLPEHPFPAAAYEALDCVVGANFGGVGMGGDGNRYSYQPAQLAFGGSGVFNSPHGFGTTAGVVLDGDGVLFNRHEYGLAGLVLGGAGFAPGPGPGGTCGTAGVLALGATYTFIIASGSTHWFTWPIISGTQYHARLTVLLGGNPNWFIWTNTCAALSAQGAFAGPGCGQFTVLFQPNGYVQVQGPAIGTCTYTLVVDLGPC